MESGFKLCHISIWFIHCVMWSILMNLIFWEITGQEAAYLQINLNTYFGKRTGHCLVTTNWEYKRTNQQNFIRTLKSFLVCFSLPSNLIKMKSVRINSWCFLTYPSINFPLDLMQMLMVALFVAVAAAYPHELDTEYKEPIAITKYGSEFNEFGKYSYKSVNDPQ